MNLINLGDIYESITKIRQRGILFFFSKITFDKKKRTKSTFGETLKTGSNWWIIPEVKQRENFKISGNYNTTFDSYLIDKYINNNKNINILSVGCGAGNREIRIAKNNPTANILGLDLSKHLISTATKTAKKENINNIVFKDADFYTFELQENHFDIILFHSALHHFRNIDPITLRIKKSLKDQGYLILNEYVGKNRLQFSFEQLDEMNKLLNKIPVQYRNRYLTKRTKNKIYAPGLIRMIISDPSEAVESETIIPIIHKHFKTIEEKKIGGDLLMMILKDIAHNFTGNESKESQKVLEMLFEEEDQYLKKVDSPDFIFGIYQNR